MSALEPIAAIGAQATSPLGTANAPSPDAAGTSDFGDMLTRGIAQMEAKVDRANELVRAFAVDDSIPVHEVTIALEEARISVELAMQIRSRMVEAYREVMNMQL